MITFSRMFPLICMLSLAACGGDDDGNADGACTGTRLTDAKICELECGVTTFSQAQTILGQPTTSSGSLLQYQYTCNEGSTSNSEIYNFSFSGGTLSLADRTGLGTFAGGTVPGCLAACTAP